MNYLFASESVSEGHPDKVCDLISDSVLDLFIASDPMARIACETLVTTNRVILAGEMRVDADIQLSKVEAAVRDTICEIGYAQDQFHWEKLDFENLLHDQSDDIAQGVDAGRGTFTEEGAGDQGIMFGYAVDETPELMPAPIIYSHQILHQLAQLRKSGALAELEPDAKSQVSLVYEDGVPVGVSSIVVSTQHKPDIKTADIRELVRPVVQAVLPEGWFPSEDAFYVNPTGQFIIGGPDGDAGLTGRKIIVDTYGGAAPHGGGAFSGKDPSKVDRSAAYACRYLAKNIVAAGLASRCVLQVSYAIGVAKPLSIFVNTQGTGTIPDEKIAAMIPQIMDLSPYGIRTKLQLNRPIYKRTAAYGHFGRHPDAEGGFSWEKTDLVEAFQAELT